MNALKDETTPVNVVGIGTQSPLSQADMKLMWKLTTENNNFRKRLTAQELQLDKYKALVEELGTFFK